MISKTPKQFRRLTKSEAEKLGVKYSSKKHVRADLKRITKKTKLYSDRQAYQQKEIQNDDGTKTRRGSKEQKTKSRQWKDDYSIRFLNVKPADFPRIIKKAQGHTTQILVYGDNGIVKYGPVSDMKFNSTPSIGEGELGAHLDRLYSERGLGSLPGFNGENPPARIDIRVRMFAKSELSPEALARVQKKNHKPAKRKDRRR